MKLVAVTACISGVAHTYMAAELIEKYCSKQSLSVSVETQGALGMENALQPRQIEEADVAIIVADIAIEGAERFANTRQVRAKISTFLRQPEKVFDALEKAYRSPPESVIEI